MSFFCCNFAGGNRIARWYYPAICRTTTMDPLAEKYYSTSPYVWCGNNPVRFVDSDGRRPVYNTKKGIPYQINVYGNQHVKSTHP